MPEGDTLFRTARTLQRALGGTVVTEFRTALANLARVNFDAPLAGRTIENVAASGKNLLIAFSGDLCLRTHLRMNGTWHVYRHGERWWKPESAMRIVIANTAYVAVAFDVPVAEFLSGEQRARHRDLRAIGPDLLSEDFDEDEAVARLRAREKTSIAEALLNQRVVAGIGNEYKSEILFLACVSPFRKIADLGESDLRSILAISRTALRANVADPTDGGAVVYRGPRRTTRRTDPTERRWAYGRDAEPCRRCGTPIESKKQGLEARLTFWCPRCQR
jgi:endonuclease-8